MFTFPPNLDAAIRAEVGSEKILWTDSPGVVLQQVTGKVDKWGTMVFFLFFTALSLYGACRVVWTSPVVGMVLALFAFCCAVPAFQARRPIVRRTRADPNACYVITERRVLIFEMQWQLRIRALDASSITGFTIHSHDGGQTGSVRLSSVIDPVHLGEAGPDLTTLHHLEFLPAAEDALRQMMRANLAGA